MSTFQRRLFIAITCVFALSAASTAEAFDATADFEHEGFTTSEARFGGSKFFGVSDGVGVMVEAVDFTDGAVAGDTLPFSDRPPASFPDGSGKYLAHGRHSLTSFTPVGKKGFYIRVGSPHDVSPAGDLYDLVSMDIANFVRTGPTMLEYDPVTVQLSVDPAPVPYTRGAAANGWSSVSTPGNLAHELGKIKFETVELADSIDPAFPAAQFRGIRGAFIGLDDIRGIDNIKVRWSRENFNVPANVSILEQELNGADLVVEGTAVFHRPSVEASGVDRPVVVTSTERRVFSWDADPLATVGLPVRVAGELDFDYVVEDGGFVEVQTSYSIRRIGSGSTGTGYSIIPLTAPPQERRESTFHTLVTEFFQRDGSPSVAGAEYELITTLTVTVDPRGGYAVRSSIAAGKCVSRVQWPFPSRPRGPLPR
jgi:hypothetical protein